MIPKRIVLENFLSFGEPGVELVFDDAEPLWVLSGPNGIGKSSVFDAITFALFGCHRGGKGQGMAELVRHGANGFRVEFEFGFAGREYRVTRAYGKKSVERVFRDGTELDLPAGKNRVRDWAEAELGLSYEQFVASVLLKQGEADKIITGSGAARLQMLKQIIGVERYEELSGRVHQASRTAGTILKELQREIDALPAVTAEERELAERTLAAGEVAVAAAGNAERTAVARVEQAKQWVALDREMTDLTAKLRAADDRRGQAADIRERAARLADLSAALPTVRQLLDLRDIQAGAVAALAALRRREHEAAERKRVAGEQADASRERAEGHRERGATADADAKELARQLADDRTALTTARDVATVDAELDRLPPDLDERLTAADTVAGETEAAVKRAAEARVVLASDLRQREGELREFGTVEIGAKCRRCLQPVSAEHAERERNELHDAIGKLRTGSATAKEAEIAVVTAASRAKAEHAALTASFNMRDKLTTKRLALTRHGELPAADELVKRVEANDRERQRLTGVATAEVEQRIQAEREHKRHDADRRAAEREWELATRDRAEAETAGAKAEARHSVLVDALRGEWSIGWEAFTATDVAALADEERALAAAGVAEQARKLYEDDALRTDWERRRTQAETDIAALPPDARITEAEAIAAATAARSASTDAASARDRAKRGFDEQTARIDRRADLAEKVKATEVAADRHARLDRLLGADGLLRDLVRTAERQIVRFANETVRNLSDGDLTIELDDAEDGPDKAFTLKVRRAADPTPIGVNYLSGSQKFRVAVSVALAVGRFATAGTHAKPLDCVIIDEGFGSLDKDGLRATAEELKRLKQHLKRIILVSHQEEFTDGFPVVAQLVRSESGTVVRMCRR